MSTYQGTCGACDTSGSCCPAPVLPSYESHLSTAQLRDLKSAAIIYTEAITTKRAGGVPRFRSHADYIKYRRAQALTGGASRLPPCRAPQSAIITQLEAVGCATTECENPTVIGITVGGFNSGPFDFPYNSYNFSWPVTWTPVPGTTASFIVSQIPGNTSSVLSYSYEITGSGTANVYANLDSYTDDVLITLFLTNECGTASVEAPAAPCFLAGSLVILADRTSKPIEDICVGDKIIGAFGEINTVLALHRPLLGTHTMCRINEEHSTSSHHPHISPNRRFFCLHPAVASSQTYGRKHLVINAEGVEEKHQLIGLNPSRIEVLKIGQTLQTINGPKDVATLEEYSLPPETQLYNLVVSGSHTYFVDGYAVTGWPREDDFDYDMWLPRV